VRALSAKESSALPAATVRRLEECAVAIHRAKKRAIECIFALGQGLKTARDLLSHHGDGTFGQWVEDEFSFSAQTARNYINVLDTFGQEEDDKRLLQSATAEALYFLSRPGTPKAAIRQVRKLIHDGQKLTLASARQMVAKCSKKRSVPQTDEQSEAAPDASDTTDPAAIAHNTDEVAQPDGKISGLYGEAESAAANEAADDGGNNIEPTEDPVRDRDTEYYSKLVNSFLQDVPSDLYETLVRDFEEAAVDDWKCLAGFLAAVRHNIAAWSLGETNEQRTKFGRILRGFAEIIELTNASVFSPDLD